MATQKDTEPIPFHEHTESTVTYGTTLSGKKKQTKKKLATWLLHVGGGEKAQVEPGRRGWDTIEP